MEQNLSGLGPKGWGLSVVFVSKQTALDSWAPLFECKPTCETELFATTSQLFKKVGICAPLWMWQRIYQTKNKPSRDSFGIRSHKNRVRKKKNCVCVYVWPCGVVLSQSIPVWYLLCAYVSFHGCTCISVYQWLICSPGWVGGEQYCCFQSVCPGVH